MVKHSNGRAPALPDSAGPMTARTRADLSESDDTLIVRVPLCEGPIELRVPREAVHAKKRPPQQHIEGFNADATPC
jgi:hypothetical protein